MAELAGRADDAVRVLIPVKELESAKSRLAGVLSPAERRELVLAMLGDVLAALDAAGLVDVAVVSPDPRVLAFAAGRGVRPLPQPAGAATLNDAIDRVALAEPAHGALAAGMLVLPADVPLASPRELAALARPDARSAGGRRTDGTAVVLVPDHAGRGTNALLRRPPTAIPALFGPDSLTCHATAARARGVPCRVRRLPRLAHDLDTPADLAAFCARPSRTRTYRLLRRLGLAPPADGVPHRLAEARLPTAHGVFRLIAYGDPAQRGREPHLALVMGDPRGEPPPLVRVHSECLTGDALGSTRCDCGPQLDLALERVAAEGRGVLLYLRQEGRGVGLLQKLRAYGLQEQGLDTVEANELLGLPADARDYRVAAAILRDLGVGSVRLLTNNPDKIAGLGAAGLRVVARVPLVVPPSPENRRYLATKREKLGHLLGTDVAAEQSSANGAAS